MTILDTALDPRAPSFLDNRSTALAALSALDAAHNQAREGGGEREVTRHHARGKLLPRERVELLVDRDTALLELAASAGAPAGAGVVTALGVVEQAICMIVANDPTVVDRGLSEAGQAKAHRAAQLAGFYQLPLIFLWESSEEARLVATGAPSFSAIFGTCKEAPPSDHVIVIKGQGEVSYADTVADDERDALRLMRQAIRGLAKVKSSSAGPVIAPRHDSDDLLAVGRDQLREVLARVLDDSAFDEFRPHRDESMLAGFGVVHGHRVAILGNCSAQVDDAAAEKGLELIRLAKLAGLPLIVLGGPSSNAPAALNRALAGLTQISVVLGAEPPAFALAHNGFRFTWPGLGIECYDGAIDPRDTRIVLGICLSVFGSTP
jgi:acetyl-CoA carboxylase carboxyltransferase component